MQTVLLLNLNRFGDLLQCQPLIHDLHASGYAVHVVCLDNFVTATSLLKNVKRIWPFPAASLLAQLDKDWQQAVANLICFCRSIKQESQASFVINLTASLTCRLLAKLLAAPDAEVLGFSLDAEGFGLNKGLWATFLCGSVLQRQNAVFNIADMFRRVALPLMPEEIKNRVGDASLRKPEQKVVQKAQALLRTVKRLSGQQPKGFIAFQLGASNARRQWPLASFALLGDLLWQKAQLCPVLLGTEGEKELGENYIAISHAPFVNVMGQTSLPELAALLTLVRLLVTNDTGTMHLAAGLGVSSLAFFLVTAQPCDTAPYLNNCLCLEANIACHPCAFGTPCQNNFMCQTQISAEAVAQTILKRLAGLAWSKSLSGMLCTQARVWLTTTDNHNFAALVNLSDQAKEDRTGWLVLQRVLWRQLLDSDLKHNLIFSNEPVSLHFSATFVRTLLPVLEQSVSLLTLLREQGHLAEKSSQAGQLFLRNCERLQSIWDSCSQLSSLAYFWRILRQDLADKMADVLNLTDKLQIFLTTMITYLRNGMNYAFT